MYKSSQLVLAKCVTVDVKVDLFVCVLVIKGLFTFVQRITW